MSLDYEHVVPSSLQCIQRCLDPPRVLNMFGGSWISPRFWRQAFSPKLFEVPLNIPIQYLLILFWLWTFVIRETMRLVCCRDLGLVRSLWRLRWRWSPIDALRTSVVARVWEFTWVCGCKMMMEEGDAIVSKSRMKTFIFNIGQLIQWICTICRWVLQRMLTYGSCTFRTTRRLKVQVWGGPVQWLQR